MWVPGQGWQITVSVCNLSFYGASSLQKLDKRLVNSFPVILLGQDHVFTESGDPGTARNVTFYLYTVREQGLEFVVFRAS